MRNLLVLLHQLAVIVWVGGKFFAHFCLRPAAQQTLEPPQRLPLMEASLRRFFAAVAAAVVLLLASGFALFFEVGFERAPLGWRVMLVFGVAMSLVFVFIVLVLYPRLRLHVGQGAWAQAGQALQSIRRLVAINLALGVATVAAAVVLA